MMQGCQIFRCQASAQDLYKSEESAVSGFKLRGLPFSTYAPWGRCVCGGGVKSPLRITCKRGDGVQIACKIAYVLNGRRLMDMCAKI